MSIILAIDFGLKRTGLAVTDNNQIIASGLKTVETSSLIHFLLEYSITEDLGTIVIGFPKKLNNTPSEIEPDILKFIKKLSFKIPNVKIERFDERFTSKIAHQTMLLGGLKKKQRSNKETVDMVSATIILQSYLSHNKS